MTDRIVYLEKGEKLLDEEGEVLIEVEWWNRDFKYIKEVNVSDLIKFGTLLL